MNAADAYTIHMWMATEALSEVEWGLKRRQLPHAISWIATARICVADAAKCVAAEQARATVARKGRK